MKKTCGALVATSKVDADGNRNSSSGLKGEEESLKIFNSFKFNLSANKRRLSIHLNEKNAATCYLLLGSA
jgi:hypothetical protein